MFSEQHFSTIGGYITCWQALKQQHRFCLKIQRLTRGRQNRQMGSAFEPIGDESHVVKHDFAIIQDQQNPFVAQNSKNLIATELFIVVCQACRFTNGNLDLLGITCHCIQRYKPHPIRKICLCSCANFDRQASFAHAPCSHNRNEAIVWVSQACKQVSLFLVTSHKHAMLQRQIAGNRRRFCQHHLLVTN